MTRILCSLQAIMLLIAAACDAGASEPVTYSTHIRRIFRDHCAGCHNASRKRAGLDLSSYGGVVQGSSSGPVLTKGDPDDSILYLSMTHAEEPAMPPGKAPLKDDILNHVKIWIETGLPESPDDIVTTSVTAEKSPPSPMENAPATNDSVLRGPQGNPVTALALSPNGKLAAVGGQLQILLFDLQEMQLKRVLPFPEGEVFSLTFSDSGESLIAGGGTAAESGRVVIMSTDTGKRTYIAGDEYDVVLAADLNPAETRVIFGGPQRVVRIADLSQGRIIGELKKHTDWVTAASFSPEGLIFATADRGGNAYVWESESLAPVHTLRGHSKSVTSIRWNASGDQCLTASEDGTLRVWNMHTGAQELQWTAHADGVLTMEVAGSEVVTAGRDKTVRHWTLAGELIRELQVDDVPTKLGAADGTLVVGDWQGRVHMSTSKNRSLVTLQIPLDRITTDPTDLPTVVAGPPAITDVVLVSSAATDTRVEHPETPPSETLLDERLERVRKLLNSISPRPNQAASESVTVQDLQGALAQATQIAGQISDPPTEVIEAQVFLRAALDRVKEVEKLNSAQPERTQTTRHPKAAEQFLAARAELAAVLQECQRLDAQHSTLNSRIAGLQEEAAGVRERYLSLSEQLEELTVLSKQVETDLGAGITEPALPETPESVNQ